VIAVRGLFDVNSLLAAFDSSHSLHGKIHNWWAPNAVRGWASCPLTQNGFARIMSQPGYPERRTFGQATDLLRVALAQPGHEFWPDDISIADASLFDHTRILGPRQITDVYLLALAVKNDGRLVTFNKSIPLAAVRGAEPRHLVVPQ
jgi:toxin-antitoxin system PIN domain toxin